MSSPRVIFATNRLPLLILVLLVLIANFNTLLNGFVYDDMQQIVNNEWITDVKYIPAIFGSDATHAELKGVSNYYRPMMNIVYLFNYYVFGGLSSWGFHLVNVLFHLGNTILVFVMASLLLDDKSRSMTPFLSVPFISALIFAVHPIHAEVVAWLGCVPELCFTFFSLLCLYFNVRSSSNYDRSHMISVASLALAMLCKETAVAILPLLVLYDFSYRTEKFDVRRSMARYLPFLAVIVIYSILRFNALSGMAPANRHPELSTYEVLLNILPLFRQYVEKLIVPLNLNAFYVLHPVHSIFDSASVLSLIIVIMTAGLGCYLYKKSKPSFFALLMIIIPLLPVLYIRKLGENSFAERYLYFPSIGFAFLAAFALDTLARYRRHCNIVVSVILVSVTAVFSALTINRNKVWHDELTLFSDTIQKSPDSSFIHFGLGVAYADRGDVDSAIKEYEAALTLDRNDYQAHYNLGLALAKKGYPDGAIIEFKEALKINPDYSQAHNNLGVALASIGDIEGAVREYKTALLLNQNYLQAHCNLGNAFFRKGNLDAAIGEYMEAVRINPADPDAKAKLKVAMDEKGRVNK